MGPHGTWFDFIPGIKGLEAQLHGPLARTWTWQSLQATHFEITHMLIAILVVLLIGAGAFVYASSVRRLGDEAILPPAKLGTRAIFEGLADMVFGLLEGVMGAKNAQDGVTRKNKERDEALKAEVIEKFKIADAALLEAARAFRQPPLIWPVTAGGRPPGEGNLVVNP